MALDNPLILTLSSVLTRPNNTTAYAQNDLIADNTAAGSIIVPSFTLPDGLDEHVESLEVIRGVFRTNLTTGFNTFAGHIDLWKSAPTFTNGDNGAWAVATGAAGWCGHMQTDTSDAFQQFADGAALAVSIGDSYVTGAPAPVTLSRSPGGVLYWTLRETDATGFTPIANQTFTLELAVRLH